jgi:hypothetical protein
MLHVAASAAFFDGTAKALAAYLVLSIVSCVSFGHPFEWC